jgi:hypothetical protein
MKICRKLAQLLVVQCVIFSIAEAAGANCQWKDPKGDKYDISALNKATDYSIQVPNAAQVTIHLLQADETFLTCCFSHMALNLIYVVLLQPQNV